MKIFKKIFAFLAAFVLLFANFASVSAQTQSVWRVNVPIYPIASGATLANKNDLTENLLDGNNWAILWAGKVSTGDNYFDLRLVGNSVDTVSGGQVVTPAGLRLRAQFIDATLDPTDTFEFTINGKTFTTKYSDGDLGGVSYRCQTSTDCRGWAISKLIPWKDITGGGAPAAGTTMNAQARMIDRDSTTSIWSGQIYWGLPNYAGTKGDTDLSVRANVISDTTIGGSTDCGDADYPSYFPTWGNRNYDFPAVMSNGATKDYSLDSLAQNEWDVSDWPCFSKVVVSMQVPNLPAGASITKVEMRYGHKGDPGYGSCYANDATKDTVFQIFEIPKNITASTLSWDALPPPSESVSRLIVQPARPVCHPEFLSPNTRDPYTPAWTDFIDPATGQPDGGVAYRKAMTRVFDVTEVFRRSLQAGRQQANLVMYTSAGQYHSGKQFYADPEVVVYYRTNGTPTSTPTPTATPSPTFDPAQCTDLSFKTMLAKKGDLNCSGSVDLEDIQILLRNYAKV